MQFRSFLVALSAAATSLLAPALAAAAPVTVDLRIEGASRTLFEGPVTTDVRTFRFTRGSDTAEHQCDGTTVGGSSPAPVPTRGAVVTAASEQTPFSTAGSFHPDFGASFTEVAGEDVSYAPPPADTYLAEFENYAFAELGACADDAQAGDAVLFAVASFGSVALKLTGPATAKPGASFTATVVNGANGAPIEGAQVGGASTGPDGKATVPGFADRGDHDLKATKGGAFVRSNRLRICVTDGADGFCGTSRPGETPAPTQPSGSCETSGSDGRCGTPDRTGPLSMIGGLRDKQTFSRATAPRELTGTVLHEFSGIASVQLRLTRRYRNRCQYLSGPKDRFIHVPCGRSYSFEVGKGTSWSYFLPERLGPGRYVLDVIAIDRFGNRSPLARNSSRMTWTVR